MKKNKVLEEKLELCKNALRDVEIEIHSWEKDESTNEKDPYLVPGAICEVWWDEAPKEKKLMYFVGNNFDTWRSRGVKNDSLHICLGFSVYKIPDKYDIDYYDKVNYRVIGTPWDYAPDWAEWIAYDSDGINYFYSNKPKKQTVSWTNIGNNNLYQEIMAAPGGIKENPSDADWETSLRKRPEWA